LPALVPLVWFVRQIKQDEIGEIVSGFKFL